MFSGAAQIEQTLVIISLCSRSNMLVKDTCALCPSIDRIALSRNQKSALLFLCR